MTVASPGTDYPVRLTIDFEPGPRNRLTAFFRLFTVIPIFIILQLMDAGAGQVSNAGEGFWTAGFSTGAVVVAPTLLMILFRQKYPHWWFAFNLEYTRFSTRVGSYFALLTDAYPSTTDDQNVHLEIDYPDVPNDLKRWMPLVKWFLAIPHLIALVFLAVAAAAVTVIAWFAILFTGNYPAGLHSFVVGVFRWALRVQAYAVLLTTDRYPPFSLQE